MPRSGATLILSILRKSVFFVFLAVLAGAAVREQLVGSGAPSSVALFSPLAAIRLLSEPVNQELAMPLRTIAVRHVANTWHASRPGARQHEGQDLFAARGTPVYSATKGLVLRVGDAGIGGNAVSVLGPGGRVYYYAHLSRFAQGLKPGAEVSTDSVLGYVGNTGNARNTPSHLHFGVYAQSGAIDPLPLLKDRKLQSAATSPGANLPQLHSERR